MFSLKFYVCVCSILMVPRRWPVADANGPPPQRALPAAPANQPSPGPVSQHDIYSQLIEMSDLCETVLDCISEYEHQTNDGTQVSEDSIPLLRQQRCNLMKTSCLTIVYVAEAAEKAALSQLADLAESL